MTDTRKAEERLWAWCEGKTFQESIQNVQALCRTVLATIDGLRDRDAKNVSDGIELLDRLDGLRAELKSEKHVVKSLAESFDGQRREREQAEAENGRLRVAATFWRGTYATLKERSIHKDEDGAFWCLVCDMADKHASDCPLRDGFGPNAGKGGEDDGN